MTNDDSISRTWTRGTIIAIVVGTLGSLFICIGVIIAIICIVKRINRLNQIRSQGVIIRPTVPYSYPPPWPNQYSSNMMTVSNYPPYGPQTVNYF